MTSLDRPGCFEGFVSDSKQCYDQRVQFWPRLQEHDIVFIKPKLFISHKIWPEITNVPMISIVEINKLESYQPLTKKCSTTKCCNSAFQDFYRLERLMSEADLLRSKLRMATWK
jgi:hypothetical protein